MGRCLQPIPVKMKITLLNPNYVDISTIVDSAVTPCWSKTTATAISIICITKTIDIDKVRFEKDTLHMQNYIYISSPTTL